MGRFIMKEVASGYKFDLVAANGQVIATSEVYETQAACRRGMQSVVNSALKAHVADLTQPGKQPPNPKFEIFQDKAGQFRFRLKARNGQIIAMSEGYTAKAGCENGIESVKKNVAQMQ